jgi:hypothetical protein
MLRRRLTALLASLVLLPSTIVAGAVGCDMGDVAAAHAPAPEAHAAGHDAHDVDGAMLLHERDTESPVGAPHAPVQCILVAGCGAAVMVADLVRVEDVARAAGRVEADGASAPDSPAAGLEPPPPRA